MDAYEILEWVEQEISKILDIPAADERLFAASTIFFGEFANYLTSLPSTELEEVKKQISIWQNNQHLPAKSYPQNEHTIQLFEEFMGTIDGIIAGEDYRRTPPSYQLRITRTNKRHKNKRLYLIEKMVHGEVKNYTLQDNLSIIIRILAEQVPVQTNIKELIKYCKEHRIPVEKIGD